MPEIPSQELVEDVVNEQYIPARMGNVGSGAGLATAWSVEGSQMEDAGEQACACMTCSQVPPSLPCRALEKTLR